MVLEFFEVDSSAAARFSDDGGDDEGAERSDQRGGGEESKAFWESQHQLLGVRILGGHLPTTSPLLLIAILLTLSLFLSLRRRSPLACSRNPAAECRSCLLNKVSEQLRRAGYDSALCHSKWRSSPDIPKGEHTYIDVVEEVAAAAEGKKSPPRVVVELRFRSEFEVFVGKPERLRGVIKVVCGAAKKCMKDNNMHIGPWRKHKYMQAKWLSPCERLPPTAPEPFFPENQPPPRASMRAPSIFPSRCGACTTARPLRSSEKSMPHQFPKR
ncbi:unnamed protein product [Spirodela intermedia]|uniref:Uncharacterized protein n=1 Tax=Spirodela intermedia TaxID=51605 RepID=A0A7I8JMY5_SPIIN|nr:unnamed protein product [Spirodela intermedia]CAA6671508.1 unnamed protein product [Spirodela intermedia]